MFAVKASRYLTHIKRLKEPQEPVARLLGRYDGLGDRRGPILLQLPPTLQADPDLKSRVDRALGWLAEDGAAASEPLVALLTRLESDSVAVAVVDMVEQGLDAPAQQALIAWLRRRGPGARPLFLMTRSSAMLDLAAVGAEEAIIFCPANHSPPTVVAPTPDAPGYEAVATCLASPEVRARTDGVVARRAG